MPTLDEIYRQFGEAAEAAQLLETDLGNLVLAHDCIEAGLLQNPDPRRATAIYDQINRRTLGQLICSLGPAIDPIPNLERILRDALAARNRLTHSFFLKHNFRRNSDRGREVMLLDLCALHNCLLEAYKAVLRLSGVDLDRVDAETAEDALPTAHLPIRT